MENVEQAETEVVETNPTEEAQPQEDISSILGNALKDKAGSPEDSSQPEEEETAEQPNETIETPYGEITLDEAKKIAFKDEKEFLSFLEKNPFLKDKFMMQSDYTRKTTQVAEERKKFNEEKQKIAEEKAKEDLAWGRVKPTPEDMGWFHSFWNVYQHGSDQLAGQLSAFVNDVALISQGKQPTGPLAGQNGQQVDFSRDSQVISVKREFDQYRQEQERKEREREEREQALETQKAREEVDSWISEKMKSGVKLQQDELKTMSLFSQIRDESGKRISLDEMYRLALAKLGRTSKEAIKRVFSDTKEHSGKTPAKPASRVPSTAKPDTSTLDEILTEGLEQLRS